MNVEGNPKPIIAFPTWRMATRLGVKGVDVKKTPIRDAMHEMDEEEWQELADLRGTSLDANRHLFHTTLSVGDLLYGPACSSVLEKATDGEDEWGIKFVTLVRDNLACKQWQETMNAITGTEIPQAVVDAIQAETGSVGLGDDRAEETKKATELQAEETTKVTELPSAEETKKATELPSAKEMKKATELPPAQGTKTTTTQQKPVMWQSGIGSHGAAALGASSSVRRMNT
eukprot:4207175-Amphidinium_carterae.1